MGLHDLSQRHSEQTGRVRNDRAESGWMNSQDGAPVLHSQELLKGSQQVWIEHEGKRYRLSATRNGKLILTK